MMDELEKIQDVEDRITSFQKNYNVSSKNVTHIIGRNLTLFVCILLPFILIGFVWTEFGNFVFHTHTLIDAILTVALFTVGEIMMTSIGADGGKLDGEYLEAKEGFNNVMDKVSGVGTIFLGAFCDWQIDLELLQITRSRVRLLKIPYKTYEAIKDLPYNQLVEKYGKNKAKKIKQIVELEPIELNEAILLYNGGHGERGGVPVSAEEHLHEKKHFIKTMTKCLFTGLLTVSIAVTLTSDISIARVIYTIFKLTMLLFRMAKGYDRGAKAYNTIEVKHLKARTNYLREYVRFMNDRTYVKLADKYEEIQDLMSENNIEVTQ